MTLDYVNEMTELNIDEFSREKMDASAEELMMEKSAAYSCLTR